MVIIVLLVLHDVVGTGWIPDVGKWAPSKDFPLHCVDAIVEVWLKSLVPVFSTQAKGEIGDFGAILYQVMDITKIAWWQLLDVPSRLNFLELWWFGP